MRRPAPALALLLLLVPLAIPLAASEAGPNRRDETLSVDDTLFEVAVAADGTVLAVHADPGGSLMLPPAPDEDTWHLWEVDGDDVQSGSADMEGCSSRLQDMCQSDAVAGTLSADGMRFAVAADVASSLTDTVRSHLILGSAAGGVARRVTFEACIRDLEFDADGDTLAVLEVSCAQQTPVQTHVRLYTWNQATATLTILFDQTLSVAATRLDLSADGQRLAVAADHHYRYHRGGTPLAHGDVGQVGAPGAVAVADSAARWSAAGYPSGNIALFTEGAPAAASYTRSPGDAAITALAFSPDGTLYVAGDQAGELHVFATDSSPSAVYPGRFIESLDAGSGPVRHVAFSQDGRFLTVSSGSQVRFLSVSGTELTDMWFDDAGGPLVGLGITSDGEHVVAAAGTSIRFYDASHEVTALPPDPVALLPGDAADIEVTYRNDGNRVEAIQFTTHGPTDWDDPLEPDDVVLEVGGSVQVSIPVNVPLSADPGNYQVHLNHTWGGGSGSTTIPVEVLAVESLLLEGVEGTNRGILAGGQAQFSVRITNYGNVASTPTLTATMSDPAWGLSWQPPGPVQPGEATTVPFTVTAPGDAQDGDRGVATVRMAGQSTPVTLTATIGAIFGVEVHGPTGGVGIPAGNHSQFEVRVENTGNVADDIDLRVGLDNLPSNWTMSFLNGLTLLSLSDLEPGAELTAVVQVYVPRDALVDAILQVQVVAGSTGDPSKVDSTTVLLTVLEPGEEPGPANGGSKGSPAPSPLAALAVLAVAVLAVRRHRGRQR